MTNMIANVFPFQMKALGTDGISFLSKVTQLGLDSEVLVPQFSSQP